MRNLITLYLLCISMAGIAQIRKVDTVREVIVVYTKIPGYVHTITGYAIQENGVCIVHLKDNHRPLKAPLYVWDCETGKKQRMIIFGHDTGVPLNTKRE